MWFCLMIASAPYGMADQGALRSTLPSLPPGVVSGCHNSHLFLAGKARSAQLSCWIEYLTKGGVQAFPSLPWKAIIGSKYYHRSPYCALGSEYTTLVARSCPSYEQKLCIHRLSTMQFLEKTLAHLPLLFRYTTMPLSYQWARMFAIHSCLCFGPFSQPIKSMRSPSSTLDAMLALSPLTTRTYQKLTDCCPQIKSSVFDVFKSIYRALGPKR